MRSSFAIVLVLGAAFGASALDASAGANPIRKVVTLMQNMQKEIEAEGEKEKELFEKFMCFCGGSGSDLEKAAVESRAKIEEFGAKLKSESAEKTQVAQDLIQHKADREGATHDLNEAANIRDKENAEFKDTADESKTNIAAMAGAIPALEKGLSGASLMQVPHIDQVKGLVQSFPTVSADDRRDALAFLENGETGSTDTIVGILKQMKETMEGDLAQATTDENQAAASFGQLKASKEEEVKLASQSIESKTARSGELAVSVVQSQDALEDEQEELKDTEKFSGNLKEQCASKQKEWDGRVKARNEEILAVSEAIKILNDDDALDTFKKAIPSSASLLQTGHKKGFAFLQARRSSASSMHKVRTLLTELASKHPSPQMGLMLFTLNSKLKMQMHGRTQNFGEVIQMVDNMITLLGKQQEEDDKQKEWCTTEFDKSEDEQKATKTKVSDLEASIAEITDSIAQLAEEINSLSQEIKALDKEVAEATEQRKAEHEDYVELVQMNDVAKSLVDKARNRMQKFYNPALYKPPPTTTENPSPYGLVQKASLALVQVSSVKSSVAPPDAPETFSGEVKKNSSSGGVLAMMDDIINDLEMGTQEAEMEEKTAQKDYNTLMSDSAEQRAESSKAITSKEANKAQLETKLQIGKQSHRDANTDLANVQTYIKDLHGSCDFMLANYAVRKEARADEMDSLNNAKSVLSGANFGF